jgi:hypothetical protein
VAQSGFFDYFSHYKFVNNSLLKVITKTEYVTRTEYIDRDQDGEVGGRPSSVMGEGLPVGPGEFILYLIYLNKLSYYLEMTRSIYQR